VCSPSLVAVYYLSLYWFTIQELPKMFFSCVKIDSPFNHWFVIFLLLCLMYSFHWLVFTFPRWFLFTLKCSARPFNLYYSYLIARLLVCTYLHWTRWKNSKKRLLLLRLLKPKNSVTIVDIWITKSIIVCDGDIHYTYMITLTWFVSRDRDNFKEKNSEVKFSNRAIDQSINMMYVV
jgi:hypothetical protein